VVFLLTGERAGARDARSLNRHALPDKTVKVLFLLSSRHDKVFFRVINKQNLDTLLH
jgi:hypothetical protein